MKKSYLVFCFSLGLLSMFAGNIPQKSVTELYPPGSPELITPSPRTSTIPAQAPGAAEVVSEPVHSKKRQARPLSRRQQKRADRLQRKFASKAAKQPKKPRSPLWDWTGTIFMIGGGSAAMLGITLVIYSLLISFTPLTIIGYIALASAVVLLVLGILFGLNVI